MQSSKTGGMGSAMTGNVLNSAFGGEAADKLLVPDCAKYIGFVVNWDWRNGDPEDWSDVIGDFPNDGFEAFERARLFDTYDYVDLAEMESGDRWFTHQYSTYGIKIILEKFFWCRY